MIHPHNLPLLPKPPAWVDQALCAQTDPEAFFPEKGGSTRPARGVCNACPVTDDCLDYAVTNSERFGIWGGHSARELQTLARRQAREAAGE